MVHTLENAVPLTSRRLSVAAQVCIWLCDFEKAKEPLCASLLYNRDVEHAQGSLSEHSEDGHTIVPWMEKRGQGDYAGSPEPSGCCWDAVLHTGLSTGLGSSLRGKGALRAESQEG